MNNLQLALDGKTTKEIGQVVSDIRKESKSPVWKKMERLMFQNIMDLSGEDI